MGTVRRLPGGDVNSRTRPGAEVCRAGANDCARLMACRSRPGLTADCYRPISDIRGLGFVAEKRPFDQQHGSLGNVAILVHNTSVCRVAESPGAEEMLIANLSDTPTVLAAILASPPNVFTTRTGGVWSSHHRLHVLRLRVHLDAIELSPGPGINSSRPSHRLRQASPTHWGQPNRFTAAEQALERIASAKHPRASKATRIFNFQ